MGETFRRQHKGGHHKLLLPLSYGVSSSVLLRTLDVHIERQHSKPYPPMTYELHVLVIETPDISSQNPNLENSFRQVQKVFPKHSYAQVPFHNIFQYDVGIGEAMSELAGPGFVDNPALSDKERLDAFRASISTPTSKMDVDDVLMRRLIVAYAKKHGCGTVMWGNSDSSLAAKTLASVAKGRGRSLTWQLCDGMSPWGVGFLFPLRDFFNTELHDYASLVPDLNDFIMPEVPVSDGVLTKNLSIDELMMRYVNSQGEKYPSVMGNVARMVTKLEPAPTSTESLHCKFCGTFIGDLDGEPGNMSDVPTSSGSQSSPFCYACTRSRPETVQ